MNTRNIILYLFFYFFCSRFNSFSVKCSVTLKGADVFETFFRVLINMDRWLKRDNKSLPKGIWYRIPSINIEDSALLSSLRQISEQDHQIVSINTQATTHIHIDSSNGGKIACYIYSKLRF